MSVERLKSVAGWGRRAAVLSMPGISAGRGRYWRIPYLDDTPDVHVHVASFNTAIATELCIRSLRMHAGCRFRLTVGDGGSTDGSLQMLEAMASRGWLKLEVDRSQPRHHHWIERWIARSDGDLLVFCDSDVEFRKPNALRALVSVARSSRSALTAAEYCPEVQGANEPIEGGELRLAERFSAWLFAVDPRQVRSLRPSFGFTAVPDTSIPEGRRAYDTGALFFADLRKHGLGYATMPGRYERRYRHFGGLTWRPMVTDDANRTGPIYRQIARSLDRLRRAQDDPRVKPGAWLYPETENATRTRTDSEPPLAA